ncbi:MAG: flippase [Deltaproteobacteria bacterium]
MARGAGWGILAQAVDKILPVAILLYLARTLGAEDFGTYSFVLAYLAFFQIAAEYSIDTVLVRSMSQRGPEGRSQVFQAGLGLKLVTATLAALAACALAGPVSGGRVPLGLMVLASLSLVSGMGAAYRSLFRATMEISWVFAIALVRAVMLASAVVAVIRIAPGLNALFGAMAAANMLAFIVIAIAAFPRLRPTFGFDRELWAELLRGALPLAGNAFALTVSLRAGQVMLMSMRGPVEVGLMGAASRVTEAFTFLPEALMISVYPLMAGLVGQDPVRLRATAVRSSRYLVAAIGVPVVACAVAGPEIMGLLYGQGFEPAGRALSVLSAMALLSATGTVVLNLLVVLHKEQVLYRNTMVFALANVALCAVMIPRFGYEGAAVAMVLTSAASQLSLALLPATREHVLPCLRSAAGAVLAVVIACAVASLSTDRLAVALPLGLSVHLAALLGLRVIDRQDLAWLRGMLTSAGSGR